MHHEAKSPGGGPLFAILLESLEHFTQSGIVGQRPGGLPKRRCVWSPGGDVPAAVKVVDAAPLDSARLAEVLNTARASRSVEYSSLPHTGHSASPVTYVLYLPCRGPVASSFPPSAAIADRLLANFRPAPRSAHADPPWPYRRRRRDDRRMMRRRRRSSAPSFSSRLPGAPVSVQFGLVPMVTLHPAGPGQQWSTTW